MGRNYTPGYVEAVASAWRQQLLVTLCVVALVIGGLYLVNQDEERRRATPVIIDHSGVVSRVEHSRGGLLSSDYTFVEFDDGWSCKLYGLQTASVGHRHEVYHNPAYGNRRHIRRSE